MAELTLSTDRAKMDVDTIHGFLRRSYWAQNRSRETVAKSLENSLCYGIFEGDRQVAFARVVTDSCTFAYLCDVFVDESYRGRGLSKRLLDAILAAPELATLRRFLLATTDAHGLYERYGFKRLTEAECGRFMSILYEGR